MWGKYNYPIPSKKTFGVVIPVYNSEHYLIDLFKDINSNVFNDVIVLFVDDGSTDDSLELCRKYVRNDERCYIIHKNHEGVSKARNIGIELLQNIVEYIGFIDSDDRINSEYFIGFDNELKHNPCIDIISSKITCNLLHEGKKFFPFEPHNYSSSQSIINAFLNFEISSAVWGKMYRISKIKNFFPDSCINEDFIFNWRNLKNIDSFATSVCSNYSYVIRNQNSLSKNYSQDSKSVILLADEINEYVQKLDNSTKELAYSFINAILIHTLTLFVSNKNNYIFFDDVKEIIDYSIKYTNCKSSKRLISSEESITLPDLIIKINNMRRIK